ncbi:ribosome biogenesis protein NOP53-like [Corticium candelabrum]|uniref:ribosome biogenesis protein NOP53-like n=1 Tax=Corticium candelabrum TaxID=121492 RepID=UPI002E274E8D|nr:ribosome biogenesis protein NOP53-like [Corticium candelabrum]
MTRKRVSKKSKKSWRKFSNVKDIEEHLEQLRAEERTGGVVVKKSNEQLFFVDKDATVEQGTAKSKRTWRPLKCEMHLWPDLRVKPVQPSTTKLVKEKKKNVKDKAALKSPVLDRCDPAIVRRVVAPKRRGLPVAATDLWAEDVASMALDPIEEYYRESTKQKPVKAPKTLKFNKPLPISAVEVAHPGASYNPSFVDHQALLHSATEVEVEKLRKESKLSRKAAMSKMSAAEREAVWREEIGRVGEDMLRNSESNENDGSGSDDETTLGRQTVRADKRKTRKRRRKELERQAQEETKRVEKIDKQKRQDLYRLRSIGREIKSQEKEIEERQETRKQKAVCQERKPKRLSKLAFEEPDIDLQLSDELAGSLRQLKPEGNLMMDRFKSFEKRGIIETRKRAVSRRKYKLKEYTKRTHRIEEVESPSIA